MKANRSKVNRGPGSRRVVALSLIAIVMLVALVLPIFIYPTVRLARITIQANFLESGVKLFSTNAEVRLNSDGVAFPGLVGSINRGVTSKIKVTIVPSSEPNGYIQQTCCQVSGDIFSGKLQLGSDMYPLSGYDEYAFRLESVPNGVRIAEGTITATVEEFTDDAQRIWIGVVSLIGLVASIIEIFNFSRKGVPGKGPRGYRRLNAEDYFPAKLT